jgi:hypothetical protein
MPSRVRSLGRVVVRSVGEGDEGRYESGSRGGLRGY